MAKKQVRGTCRLCLKDRVLCKSHYVGHAIQRLCRQPGEDPILMTPKVILATPRQLWAYLLCQRCEDRLNRLGENIVLRWLDNNRGFRLLEWMQRSCVVKDEGGVVTFSARDMGIDTEPFAHFGLGLLWKGAVHKWNTVEGQTTSVSLGPYEESIRRYLLGEVGLPDGVYVILAVCADKGSRGMVYAKALQKLTASGPRYLKFYSLIAKHAAELEILVHENFALFMALSQHLENYARPMMVLGLYAWRSALTSRIVSKYNRCLRLARYAANYPDRWVLGRALTNIVKAIGPYLITLRSEGRLEAERAFARSALQICKLAAWIGDETGDATSVVMAVVNALLTTHDEDSEAYRWADQTARSLRDPELRADALLRIERAKKRWKGEAVEGDYQGDPIWQAIQNMATVLGIDLSDENDPLVRGLRIAAKDNSPERVLASCEHILVSQATTVPRETPCCFARLRDEGIRAPGRRRRSRMAARN